MRSIGLRMYLIILVLLTVIPAMGLIAYSAIELRRDTVAHSFEEVDRLSYLLAKDVGNLIDNPREVLGSIAAVPALQEGDLTDV
ncbi:MAG: hypothetical protein ACYC5Q_12125 [Thermoleophilia bacterium]